MVRSRITKALILYLAIPCTVWGQMPILPGVLSPQIPTGGYTPPSNNTNYGAVPSSPTSTTTINTSTSPGATGTIGGVRAGDIFINDCGTVQTYNSSVASSSSPSVTFTLVTPSLVTGTLFGQSLSYGTGVPSNSNAAYATCTAGTAFQGGQAEIFVDITCGSCGTPVALTSTKTTGTVSSISMTGINCTAGAHGCYVLIAASAGTTIGTWQTGSLTGCTFDIIAVSDGPGSGAGTLVVYRGVCSASLSGATATMNNNTPSNAMTASGIAIPF
jgi:hypothetical protein